MTHRSDVRRVVTSAGGTLRIPGPIAAAMVAHARSELPNEACGVLSGSPSDGLAVAFHPTGNAEASPYRYNIHPDDLLRVTLDIEDAGSEIVGIFHSHVASAAVPSETDKRLAFYPEAFYVLVSLMDDAQPDIRAWRITDGEVREAGLIIG